ncbi:MAG: hypothetical protein CL912_31345 [Deltaproteobacteria bacterium]|nr:hypothetical protein [Deltaproteobacteria bacterium]
MDLAQWYNTLIFAYLVFRAAGRFIRRLRCWRWHSGKFVSNQLRSDIDMRQDLISYTVKSLEPLRLEECVE